MPLDRQENGGGDITVYSIRERRAKRLRIVGRSIRKIVRGLTLILEVLAALLVSRLLSKSRDISGKELILFQTGQRTSASTLRLRIILFGSPQMSL